MLTLSDKLNVMDILWEEVDAVVSLPADKEKQFLAPKGPIPSNDLRIGNRYFARDKAILIRGQSLLGVYTKDISRRGIGFLSPSRLESQEQVELLLSNQERLRLQIVRCARLEDGYFECGAKFLL